LIGNNIYTLKAEGKGVDSDCLANPVTVGLTIGIDSGSTAVRAEFEKRKKRDHRRPRGGQPLTYDFSVMTEEVMTPFSVVTLNHKSTADPCSCDQKELSTTS
jgi:hypothetical protein